MRLETIRRLRKKDSLSESLFSSAGIRLLILVSRPLSNNDLPSPCITNEFVYKLMRVEW
jgi:hypothetical protein